MPHAKQRKTGQGPHGLRAIGPDGYPDDNYFPLHRDMGCRLNKTCLDCPMVKCIEDFAIAGNNQKNIVHRAIEHHIQHGGAPTERLRWLYEGGRKRLSDLKVLEDVA